MRQYIGVAVHTLKPGKITNKIKVIIKRKPQYESGKDLYPRLNSVALLTNWLVRFSPTGWWEISRIISRFLLVGEKSKAPSVNR